MTPFERLMVSRMDSFVDNHELCDIEFQNMDARFQTLDEQIEVVQKQHFQL